MFGYRLISKKKLQHLKEENAGLRKYLAEIDAEILELQKQFAESKRNGDKK